MRILKTETSEIPVHTCPVVVVGSGASGLAAACRLAEAGTGPVTLICEAMSAGTSRNTGSDKQTYYKLSLAGSDDDSITRMAKTLFSGGCMDGDLARVEAALSAQCFARLRDLGVPFPSNEYGEAVGYKTDHDPYQRATSAGPLTSKLMTEAWQQVLSRTGVMVRDQWQVIRLFSDAAKKSIRGLLCLNRTELDHSSRRYQIILCSHVVWAVGGPALLYADSVYPFSQAGATGLALEAGALAKNLTEWQYGLASVKPRWNVSGSFQQVLPRYFSVDQQGENPVDFLDRAIPDLRQQLSAIFLKGYQWPFDVRKIDGSSLIDLLVYQETVLRGRRVFIDFRSNPGGHPLDFSQIAPEAADYLQRAGADQLLPIERLSRLNQPAIDFYASHGVDLALQPLEIRLCAQHHNGGLSGDLWWQSNLQGLYPIGEVNGSHGVYRPGGSALNSGQVAALRAAESINRCCVKITPDITDDQLAEIEQPVLQLVDFLEQSLIADAELLNIHDKTAEARVRMSRYGGPFRSLEGLKTAYAQNQQDIEKLMQPFSITSTKLLPSLCRYRELLLCQQVYLAAMLDYMIQGGGSRGSALYLDSNAHLPARGLPDFFRSRTLDLSRLDQIQEVSLHDGQVQCVWRPVRPLPEPVDVFEVVWQAYRQKQSS